METYQYEKVSTKPENEVLCENVQVSWKPFARQLLVCSGLWTTYFVTGLSLGAPTVVIPQIRRHANSTAAVSDEMSSWLSSALSYSTIPWVIILPALTRPFGRKIPFLFACVTSIVSFFIFYYGTTTTHFLISQVTQGILFGSNLTVSIIMVTEYTSPKYRGVFLTIKSASLFWGMWASNAIGTFYHWNNIGLCGLICSVYYISMFMWPESPYWLASQGRFDECAKSHRWLKGRSKYSENELEQLIHSQREFLNTPNNIENDKLRVRIKKLFTTLACREFYKPILLSVLVLAQYHASGKVVCSMYSIELIKKITDSESAAYAGMLILDGVSVFGMYFGCLLSKFVFRRTLLLWTSAIGIIFIFLISLYLCLVNNSVVTENKIVTVSLLAAFSVTISCGPMIMSTSIYGELIPLRFKSSAVTIIILFHFTFMGTAIKVAPHLFKTFTLQGAFFLYGVLASVFTVILYKCLPETKDKTLQEIEEFFKDKSR